MAGDWIKMRSNLRRHPKVVRMASALNADRLRIVGGLHAVWCLFDEHSEDGHLCGYTTSAVDEEIGFPGFCCQLVAIDWLVESAPDCLKLPEFDTHNGDSAKRRAQEADRKRVARKASAESLQLVRTTSASDADKKRTREEKKREEIVETPRASALPQDWKLPEAWKAWAIQQRQDIDPEVTADSFRDYWIAKPGKDGRKLDWEATWRNWVRNQRQGTGSTSGPIGYVPSGKPHY